jgi:hypothetical protein
MLRMMLEVLKMTNFEKLEPYKQRAVLYEITGKHTRQQIAEQVGDVTPETISNWRKDPLYQAAKQEKSNELNAEIFGEISRTYKGAISGMETEIHERVIEKQLGELSFDKLVRLFITSVAGLKEHECEKPKSEKDEVDASVEHIRKRIRERSGDDEERL